MLNSLVFFYKKNSSFSFVFYYLEKSYTFCNRFSLKIYYLISLKYLQMINCSLFILIKSVKFHKFDDAFNSFDSEFASCNIVC